jgi:hypothetical protein
MTTIRDRSTPDAEPRGLLVNVSGDVRPFGLVASGVIRRVRHELPVAVGPHLAGRPPRPVAPYREERCPATPNYARLEMSRS